MAKQGKLLEIMTCFGLAIRNLWLKIIKIAYSVFHRYRQAKFTNIGLILGSSQFFLLPQVPLKTTLAIKLVKID